ncbi:uncharacterized protein LOC118397997 isoform X2 [Oncorhynchus keta]|uniref:uncharacterized protein LOC118397997 isoform X2 n=1 Tax=Oncorhynchus keta TaxID=8018 RepID=UPI00227B1242|nr:uncharacterized protein LOC118397997 isoform X2 [Oncorhynchus keta]XP_052326038.1 uncharacterized protein LOC118397997 isoform X2 [Oncorhynchus keta]
MDGWMDGVIQKLGLCIQRDNHLICTSHSKPVFVSKILHSIFFLGLFRKPQKCTPHDILGEFMPAVKEIFSGPFENYTSKLPKRTPFSSVLDMVVSLLGPDIEINILVERLQEIANRMSEPNSKYKFNSSTICVSQRNDVQRSYYGASMSCNGKQEGQIMVAVSCLSTWHCGVSNAVMTYKPDKNKRKNFDGTMKLQEYVKCQASNVKSGEEMSPCRSCGHLFGLEKPSNQMWPYGNCAEAESLSKLLYGEEEIVKNVVPSVDCKMREQVVNEVKAHLEEMLKESEFQWDSSYYIPQ